MKNAKHEEMKFMIFLRRLGFAFCILCLMLLFINCPIAYAKSGTTWEDVGAKFLELEKARSGAIEAISKKPVVPTMNPDTSDRKSKGESSLKSDRSSELNQKPNKLMDEKT